MPWMYDPESNKGALIPDDRMDEAIADGLVAGFKMADPESKKSGWIPAEKAREALDDGLEIVSALEDTERPKYSPFESASMGAGQGFTAGFADELAGAANAMGDNPMDYSLYGAAKNAYEFVTDPEKRSNVMQDYQTGRDDWRMKTAQAEEDNPMSYLGGDIVGSVAGAAVPGGAALKGAQIPNAMGRIGANVGLGIGSGMMQGAGRSEASDLEQLLKDTAQAGIVGGATAGAGSAGLEALAGTAGYAKNVLNKFPQAKKTLGKFVPEWMQGASSPVSQISEKLSDYGNIGADLKDYKLKEFVGKIAQKNPSITSAVQSKSAITPERVDRLVNDAEKQITNVNKRFSTGGNFPQGFGALGTYLNNQSLPNQSEEVLRNEREQEIRSKLEFSTNKSNTYNEEQ